MVVWRASLWFSWERICLQCGRPGFDPWLGKIPWRRERLPTPVFWPGEFHALYSPWGCKELDTTECLSLHFTSLHELVATQELLSIVYNISTSIITIVIVAIIFSITDDWTSPFLTLQWHKDNVHSVKSYFKFWILIFSRANNIWYRSLLWFWAGSQSATQSHRETTKNSHTDIHSLPRHPFWFSFSVQYSRSWKTEGRRTRGRRGWDVGGHHQLNGHESEQAPGDRGQRSLACCSPRGHRESDRTERPNGNKAQLRYSWVKYH